jgi:hypothetical protein
VKGKKAAIMIYLAGGPSHIDTYDLKPDAPAEHRGEFKPIQTNVPGVQICELFPLQARMWDKLACIRTVVCAPEHSDSETHTGYPNAVNRTAHHPSFGAVVSKLRQAGNGIPPFVSLRKKKPDNDPNPEFSQGLRGGFLGQAYRAFEPSGPGMADLRLSDEVSLSRLDDRKKLLASFDSIRRDIDASGTMESIDGHTARALDLIVSGTIHKALDLRHEDARTRARYKGVEPFLLARRLVEAGVGCLTLGYDGWDTHGNNFPVLRKLLPQMDRGISNLVQDLCDRGMDKDVVTVMWGEFGRTPKINDSKLGPGRDHWPQTSSALIAGGGLKMGQVIGSTTANAETPKERPYRVAQVLATLYKAIGIDPSKTELRDHSGRPMYLLDEREPVKELV